MGGQKIRSEVVMKKFGQNLKEVRRSKKMTQEELSASSGVALSQISRIETGKLNTTISTISFLASALEISPELLVEDISDSGNS